MQEGINVVYIKDDEKFIVTMDYLTPNKVWISRADGEGGTFDAKKLGDAIFDAIEKFYEENF